MLIVTRSRKVPTWNETFCPSSMRIKKRRASASVAIQEDRDAIRRAKVRETSQKHRAKRAQQTEDPKMRKEALEAALALLKSAGSSG